LSAERLQKVLASAGVASRRDCEELISAGRVSVIGRVMRVPGTRVDPEQDEIAVDGQPIGAINPRTYVMLHKPTGVVSTADDPQGRPTVVEMVDAPVRLFPIGRLDYDSEGLLLLTDDGELTQRLTHPSYQVEKEYRALLDRAPSPEALREWRNGVMLEDVRTAPAWVDLIERGDEGAWVRVVLHEGRKRQIREVAAALGYEVLRLIRVREGPLLLGDLPPGQWRNLTDDEVESLWSHVGGQDAELPEESRAAERAEAPQRRRRASPVEGPAGERRPTRRRPAVSDDAGIVAGPDTGGEPSDEQRIAPSRAEGLDADPDFRQTERPRRDDRGYGARGPSGDDRGPRRDDRGYDARGPRRDDRGYGSRGPSGGERGNERGYDARGPRRDDRGYDARGPRRDDRGYGSRGPSGGERGYDRGYDARGPRRDDRGYDARGPRRDDRGYGSRGPSSGERGNDRGYDARGPRRDDRG
jgi:23S rRNA pseudouridine2605 synthase